MPEAPGKRNVGAESSRRRPGAPRADVDVHLRKGDLDALPAEPVGDGGVEHMNGGKPFLDVPHVGADGELQGAVAELLEGDFGLGRLQHQRGVGHQLYLDASSGTADKGNDSQYSTTDFGASRVSLSFTGNAGERLSLDRNWVAIYQDEVVEGTETFNISYALGPLPGEGPLPPVPAGVKVAGPATGTIIDDDGSATVTIADASAIEGGAVTFTATVDKAVQGGVTVTPSFTDGTATGGTDYTESTTSITFAAAAGDTQTFTVATTEDAVEESDETFTVGLTVSGTTLVTATDTAVGTIVDDDGPASVTVTDVSAAEGGLLTFTVKLNQAVAKGLTVTPSLPT